MWLELIVCESLFEPPPLSMSQLSNTAMGFQSLKYTGVPAAYVTIHGAANCMGLDKAISKPHNDYSYHTHFLLATPTTVEPPNNGHLCPL